MRSIRQNKLETLLQHVPDRLPVDAGRLHGHLRHTRRLQPIRQFQKPAGRRCKTPHLVAQLVTHGKPNAGNHFVLVHVETSTPTIEYLHRHLLMCGAAGVRPSLTNSTQRAAVANPVFRQGTTLPQQSRVLEGPPAKLSTTALDRTSLSQVILDGFFARTALDDLPRETRRTGLQEFGLPYASDPVISKHLARFLTRSLQNVQASDKLGALVGSRAGGPALMPTAVLFNGGVFKAGPIRARVLDLLASWNGGQAVRELEGFEPDLAVAQGAAIYGQHRATGKGMRIKAGAARSYYVGLETSMPAIPGFRPPVKALCVVHEEAWLTLAAGPIQTTSANC